MDNGIAATGLLPFLVFLFHQLAALRAAHYKLNNLSEGIALPVSILVLHEIEHQPLLLEHHFLDTHSAAEPPQAHHIQQLLRLLGQRSEAVYQSFLEVEQSVFVAQAVQLAVERDTLRDILHIVGRESERQVAL